MNKTIQEKSAANEVDRRYLLVFAVLLCSCVHPQRNSPSPTPRPTVPSSVSSPKTATPLQGDTFVDICERQNRLLLEARKGSTFQAQLEQMKKLAATYRSLTKLPGVPPAVLKNCRMKTKDALRIAEKWHLQAQRIRPRRAEQAKEQNDLYNLAELAYKEYLVTLPQEHESYTMRYYHAELLYKIERFEEAAEEYEKVVAADDHGKYRNDSAYAALICWNKILYPKDDKMELGSDVLVRSEGTRSRERRHMIASTTYFKIAPRSPEAVAILLRQARISYQCRQYRQAIEILARVVDEYLDNDLASLDTKDDDFSADGVMYTADKIKEWTDQMLSNPRLPKDPLHKELIAIQVKAKRQKADAKVKKERDLRCHKSKDNLVARYSKVHRNSKEASEVRWLHEDTCFEDVFLLGELFEKYNDNNNAVAAYEACADLFPQGKKAPEAMFRAVKLRLALGQRRKARKDFELMKGWYAETAHPELFRKTQALLGEPATP